MQATEQSEGEFSARLAESQRHHDLKDRSRQGHDLWSSGSAIHDRRHGAGTPTSSGWPTSRECRGTCNRGHGEDGTAGASSKVLAEQARISQRAEEAHQAGNQAASGVISIKDDDSEKETVAASPSVLAATSNNESGRSRRQQEEEEDRAWGRRVGARHRESITKHYEHTTNHTADLLSGACPLDNEKRRWSHDMAPLRRSRRQTRPNPRRTSSGQVWPPGHKNRRLGSMPD